MERRFKYIVIAIAVIVSFIVFCKIKILLEGEEGRIKRVIYAAKSATEQENLFKCISFISQSYADRYGNDRRSLLLIGKEIFQAYDNIIIGIRQLKISSDTDTAEAEVEATGIAINVERKETNIFETETIKFLIFFQKEEGGWKVRRLEFLEPQKIVLPGIT
jgi:hypothetical protein